MGICWYKQNNPGRKQYVLGLGRFITSDPNSTGIPTQSSLAMLGKMPVGPPSGSFGWESHYGDGWDTYTAYGANPIMHQDPSGLFFLGFIGGGGVGMDIYADYADEVMGSGTSAMGFVNSSIQDASYAQADMVDMIMDWDLSPDVMIGMNASGMNFQTGGSHSYAMAKGGMAASWAAAAAYGHDKHHIIPRFLMGRYSWANRLDLPSGLHSELHEHITRAFLDAGLPAPNSGRRGVKNGIINHQSWRNAFRNGDVTADILQQAQRAMIAGSKSFDADRPGYRVAARVRLAMNRSAAVGRLGRLVKYGGKIQ